jgi:hypothetical protein
VQLDRHSRGPPRRFTSSSDRRFNRRRYDAANTIAAFSARLREEAMQPTRASLWLRPSGS